MPRNEMSDDAAPDNVRHDSERNASQETDVPVSATVRHATGSDGHDVETGLARELSEFARYLQAEQSVEALLQRITETAVAEIDAAEHGGISLIVDKMAIETRAATSELVKDVDRVQHETGQGPCVSSLHQQLTVRSDDLSTEQRWPDFAAAAVRLGVRSMLSVQLFATKNAASESNLGALNLCSSHPNAFDEHDESTAIMLAAHAAVAMQGADTAADLRVALASRDVIGQGKGILMERYKISAQEAFHLLVLTSQRTQRKLRDVADELATTGDLDVG